MSQPGDHICKKNPADYRTKMVATSVECSSYNLLNPIRSGGGGRGFKSPPLRFFCPHIFNFGAALLCVGDFS